MTRALLLDLGNVVLEVDFRRTFRRWATTTGVPAALLEERWQLDDAYCAHERGELEFEAYVHALGARLGIDMPLVDWLDGWNDLFVAPYARVQQRLAATDTPLYAFTNTNPTHEQAWRARYADALVHFREIFVSSTLGARKPERIAFEIVAERMGLAPADIVFLDDTLENVEGAADAGFNAVWVRSQNDVVRALDEFGADAAGD